MTLEKKIEREQSKIDAMLAAQNERKKELGRQRRHDKYLEEMQAAIDVYEDYLKSGKWSMRQARLMAAATIDVSDQTMQNYITAYEALKENV